MSSDNLGAPSVAVGQSQKEVTINAAVNKLDNATQGVTALTISGTRTLTAAEFTGGYSLELTGTPGAAFTLNVPASRRSFRVDNATDGNATVQVDGGAGASVVVAAGAAAFLYCDGADITEEGSGGGGGSALATEDEGTEIIADTLRLNFTGAGVAASDAGGGEATVNVPGVETQEAGAAVVSGATALNFDGDDFDLTDTGGGTTAIALADQGAETRVNHTGTDQNIGASRTQIQWNNEIRDEGGWHDPATNNERIVIGTETVDVDVALTLLNLDSPDIEARIARYNSADALQDVHAQKIAQGASLMLHAMNVRGEAAGDYLVVDLLSADTSYDVDGDESYMMVRRAGAAGGSGGGTSAELLATHDFAATPASEVIVTGIDVGDEVDIIVVGLGSGTSTLGLRVQLSTDNGATTLDGAADYHIGLLTAAGGADSDNDELGYIGGSSNVTSGIYGGATVHSARLANAPTWAEFRGSHGGDVSWRYGMAKVVQAHNALVLSHLGGAQFNAGQVYVVRR